MCKGDAVVTGFYNINHFNQVTKADGQEDLCEVEVLHVRENGNDNEGKTCIWYFLVAKSVCVGGVCMCVYIYMFVCV